MRQLPLCHAASWRDEEPRGRDEGQVSPRRQAAVYPIFVGRARASALRQDAAMTSRDSSHVAGPAASGAAAVPSRALAEFVAGVSLSHVPAPVRERALLLMLDAIGVGLAARRYPFSERTLAAAMALGGGEGASTVIGHSERLPLRDAALVNGVLLHGLDFDDTHLSAIIHTTVACLPTAFGVAEGKSATGADLLAGSIAGRESRIL